MVGIALVLDPAMKKDYLKNVLDWEKGWVESVDNHFVSSFDFYSSKSNSQKTTNYIPILETESLFAKFKRRKPATL